MAVSFQDLFTGADGTQLLNHTPNVPGTGVYDANIGTSSIQGNRLDLRTSSPGAGVARFTQDVVGLEGNGDWFFDVQKNGVEASNSSISLRARSTVGPSHEAVQLVIQFTSATTVNLFIQRTDFGGVGIDSFLVASFSFVNGQQLRFGLTLTGLTAQAWTEPYGGGTRTNRGAAQTLTATYSDSGHRRIAVAKFDASFIGDRSFAFVDGLTSGVPGKVIIPAGIVSGEAFGTPIVQETAFGTECHAVTKAAIPVFAEIECTPPA